MTIVPRSLGSREAFLKALFHDLKLTEGAVPRVYTDHKGIPTVGIGYALLVVSGGRYRIRPDLEADLTRAGIDLNGAEGTALRDILARVRELLNAGKVAEAQQRIPPFVGGEDSRAKNPTGLPFFSDDQIRVLLETVIVKYENLLRGKLQAETLYESLAHSWEKIALVSLTYNSPSLIGPGLRGALQAGDRAEAWFQIRHFSNGKKNRGLAKRRYLEASRFGLYNDPARITLDEARAVMAMYARRKGRIDPYEAALGEMIALANRDYGLTGDEAVGTLAESLAPARQVIAEQG